MDTLHLVSIQNQLSTDVKKNEIKKKVVARLTELGLVDAKYKNSNEHLLLVCNLIEHVAEKSKKNKINKKELALDILQQVFSINATERIAIDSNIEFLWENKSIKKISKFRLFCCGFFEYFSKKKE